jgi:hypothetical protein
MSIQLKSAALEKLLSIEQAADILGKPIHWVRRQIKAGKLPAFRMSENTIRIQPAELRRFQQEVTPLHVRRRQPPKEKISGVYFLRFPNGLTKIGRSADIHARIAALQITHTEDLRLVAVQPSVSKLAELEKWFHRKLKAFCIRSEIFDLTESQIREAIEHYQFQKGEPS